MTLVALRTPDLPPSVAAATYGRQVVSPLVQAETDRTAPTSIKPETAHKAHLLKRKFGAHCSGRCAACDAVKIFTEGSEENQDLHFRFTQTLFISLVSFCCLSKCRGSPESVRGRNEFAGDPPSLGFRRH